MSNWSDVSMSQVRPRDRCVHEMGVSSSQMVNEVGVSMSRCFMG
jgi:hypothetical protein